MYLLTLNSFILKLVSGKEDTERKKNTIIFIYDVI